MSELLEDDDLTAALKKCPEWDYEKKAITRTVEFEEFMDAIDFVNDLAEIAEEAQHHPDITIKHTKVTLRLTTHDAGGVTELDVELADGERMVGGPGDGLAGFTAASGSPFPVGIPTTRATFLRTAWPL